MGRNVAILIGAAALAGASLVVPTGASAGPTFTLTGSNLSTVPLATPGLGASATYSSGEITLSSPDNVGGGGFAQFSDTAEITIPNGFDGASFGTLTTFLSSGASFNLLSATAFEGQYAYWDVTISNGTNTYTVNAFGDNNLGANPFNSGQSVDTSCGWTSGGSAIPGCTFGESWTTLASTYGSYNVTGVTIDVGGWNTGETQTDVVNSITLPGVEAVPEPTSLALLGTALVGVGFLRRRRKVA